MYLHMYTPLCTMIYCSLLYAHMYTPLLHAHMYLHVYTVLLYAHMYLHMYTVLLYSHMYLHMYTPLLKLRCSLVNLKLTYWLQELPSDWSWVLVIYFFVYILFFLHFFSHRKLHNHKSQEKEAGEMVELLRIFVTLVENWILIPSAKIGPFTTPATQIPGDLKPSTGL